MFARRFQRAALAGAFSFLTVCACIAPAQASASPAVCAAASEAPLLRLGTALALFDACSPTLVQADAQLAAARADQISNGHVPNPTLGLGVSNINPQFGTGGGALRDRTVDSTVRIDQLIERGGKRVARRAAAAANGDAAQLLRDDALQRGHQSVLEAYAGLSTAMSEAAQLRADADSYLAGLQAMRQRLGAGDVALADVNRAALDAARAAADADAAELSVLQARATLSTTLGIGPLRDATRLEPLATLAGPVRAAAGTDDTASDYETRPDLRAAAARLGAAQASLSLADAGRKRDVDLTLGYDHWPASPTNAQGTGNSYTVGISMPLFLYDSGRGAQLRARADMRTAQSDLDSRRASAERELATTRQQALQAQALAERYRTTLLPAAEQILQAEELAYQRGAAGLLDLLDARRSQRQVAVAALGAERDALTAAGRLELARGRDPLRLLPTPALPAAANPETSP